MDELSEKLSALLGDPDGMARIRDMAQSLLGSQEEEPETESPAGDIDLGAVTRLMGMMKQGTGDDSRVRLLMALKPNLSAERQGRVDNAVKILKLLELAPLLKEAGLFNL
jgi:hypothetical protein